MLRFDRWGCDLVFCWGGFLLWIAIIGWCVVAFGLWCVFDALVVDL